MIRRKRGDTCSELRTVAARVAGWLLLLGTRVLSPAPVGLEAPAEGGREAGRPGLWEQRLGPAVVLPDAEFFPSFTHLSRGPEDPALAPGRGRGAPFLTVPDSGKERKDGPPGSSTRRPGCLPAAVLSWSVIFRFQFIGFPSLSKLPLGKCCKCLLHQSAGCLISLLTCVSVCILSILF